ncbi:MAG: VOC family protein [Deltaproteobacteria bacterium]|nr:VOC family protein [Deltaproteobacteria bacterium]
MSAFLPAHAIHGISHVNIVVDDIEIATELYGSLLGFEPARNADGPMDYRGVDLASFARNAGFADGKVHVDIQFLRHPRVGLFLELMRYRHPQGSDTAAIKAPYDVGGIKHIAFVVDDAVGAYEFIRAQQERYAQRGLSIRIRGDGHVPEQLTPFPYKFFYWIDPWGVQWEMEEGRTTEHVIRGSVG